MKITINTREYKEVEVDFNFPFYRAKYIGEDEAIYWKFESENVASKIHVKMIETSIVSISDPNTNLVQDWITSEDMLFGYGAYDVITASIFKREVKNLQSTIDNL